MHQISFLFNSISCNAQATHMLFFKSQYMKINVHSLFPDFHSIMYMLFFFDLKELYHG